MVMQWPMGNGPADHMRVTTPVFRNAFFSTETPTFTFIQGIAAATYEVRNFYGDIVGTGVCSGTTLTLPGPLPLGWYKLYLVRATPVGVPWLSAAGEILFSVVRPDSTSPLCDRPGPNTLQYPAGGDIGADVPASVFFGIGPIRHKIADLATQAGKDGAANEVEYELSFVVPDSYRPLKPLTAIPNGLPLGNSTQDTNLTAIVQACVAKGGVWFEGANEPNISMDYNAYAPLQNHFADVVHAASGTAKVMGPCPLSITGDGYTDGHQLQFMNRILPLIGSKLDAISFHNYEAPWGNLTGLRKVMDTFVEILTLNGQQNKPRWNTEFGSTFAAANGDNTQAWQVKNTMLELHVHEQYLIPKEQTFLFYPLSHGFWGYPSFWMNREWSMGQPSALPILYRIWAEELFGRAYSQKLDFGSENVFWIGSKFVGAGGISTVVVQSGGLKGNVTFTVTGASSVNTVDGWGNITTRPVTGGIVTFEVDYIPTYIRCPIGVTATPVAIDYGIEVINRQGSTTTATSNPSTAYLAANGSQDFPVGAPDSWVATDGNFPIIWTATFPVPTRFNRFAVDVRNPYQPYCTLMDFDVEAQISGTWTKLATFTEVSPYKVWCGTNDSGGGWCDTFGLRRNQWMQRLSNAVTATGIRVVIRDASNGGGMVPDAWNQSFVTVTGAPTGGTFTLTWNGKTTAAIARNATPAQVLTALQATSGGSNFIRVYGSNLVDGIALVQTEFFPITSANSFTGGSSPSVLIEMGEIGQGGPKRPQILEVMCYLNEVDLGKINTAPLLAAI